jgi:hypothetical protein
MSECPTCGRRIRGEVCPYCEENLGDDDSVDSTPVSGESMVAVYGCEHQWQADFILSALEAEGIPAYTESQATKGDIHLEDIVGAPDGSILITVEEEDADSAREIAESAHQELEAGQQ